MPKTFNSQAPKFSGYYDVIGWLNDQAHSGTEKSMKNLEDFIANEKHDGLVSYAKIALDEAKYFYYCSNNEQEEKDFLLAKMIRQREEKIFDLEMEIDMLKLKLEKLNLDKKVHGQVLKNLDSRHLGKWGIFFSDAPVSLTGNELNKLEDEFAYLEIWVAQARKMIKTERFKQIPNEVIDHIHLDGDDEDFK